MVAPARKDRSEPLPSTEAPQGREAAGARAALIVEDNVIIAMEIDAFLEDFGVAERFVAGTVENALLVLQARDIGFAVVDVDLGAETSEDVALALHERGLPFVFSTGYDGRNPMVARFPGVPLLTKPFSANMLYRALRQIGVG